MVAENIKKFQICKNDGNSQNIIFVLATETEILLWLVTVNETEYFFFDVIYSELQGEILDCNMFGVEVIINII